MKKKILISNTQLKGIIKEVSQSKKIKEYIKLSAVLDWYEDKKDDIARVLEVDKDNLISIDELLDQNYELVTNVINRQQGGNPGGGTSWGFESFKPLELSLIHDLLHNLYNVKTKEFGKSLQDFQFTESELVEEIEILSLEESFMKYMGIRYPKTDFINQNINQLVSFLIPVIMRDDPERILNIAKRKGNGEGEYLKVYGKKYDVNGTPFEGIFEDVNIDNLETPITEHRKRLDSPEEKLKTFLIDIYELGMGITETGGDRALLDIPQDSVSLKERANFFGRKEDITSIDEFAEIENEIINNDYETIETRDELDEFLKKTSLDESEKQDLINTWNNNYYDSFYYPRNISLSEIKINEIHTSHSELVSNDDEVFIDVMERLREEEYDLYIVEDIIGWRDINEDISELMEKIFDDDNASSLLRRYFRTNTIIKNNTSLYESGYKNYGSISKNLMTKNAKKLRELFDGFRGYVIKNFEKYKNEDKKYSDKSESLKNVLPDIKFLVSAIKIYNETINGHFKYVLFFDESGKITINSGYKGNHPYHLRLYNNKMYTNAARNLIPHIKNMGKFLDKHNITDDERFMQYMKNYVSPSTSFDVLRKINQDGNIKNEIKNVSSYLDDNFISSYNDLISSLKNIQERNNLIDRYLWKKNNNNYSEHYINKINDYLNNNNIIGFYKFLKEVFYKQVTNRIHGNLLNRPDMVYNGIKIKINYDEISLKKAVQELAPPNSSGIDIYKKAVQELVSPSSSGIGIYKIMIVNGGILKHVDSITVYL